MRDDSPTRDNNIDKAIDQPGTRLTELKSDAISPQKSNPAEATCNNQGNVPFTSQTPDTLTTVNSTTPAMPGATKQQHGSDTYVAGEISEQHGMPITGPQAYSNNRMYNAINAATSAKISYQAHLPTSDTHIHELWPRNSNKPVSTYTINSFTTKEGITTEHIYTPQFLGENPRFLNLPPKSTFIYDAYTELPALVDSGASLSVIPKHIAEAFPEIQTTRDASSGDMLRDFMGVFHKTEGKCMVNPNFNLGINEPHQFIISSTKDDYLILGLDYMLKHKLTIDLGLRMLINEKTKMGVPLFINDSAEDFGQDLVDPNNSIEPVRISEVVADNEPLPSCETPIALIETLNDIALSRVPLHVTPTYGDNDKYDEELHIEFQHDAKRRFSHAPRRHSAINKIIIETSINDQIERGVTEAGTSDMASPVTIVRKKNGEPRLCIDYRQLNSQTADLKYPMSRIDTIFERVIPGKHCWFSVLDLREAYYAVKLSPESRKKAAMITHHGCFLPKRAPFGLKQSPAAFCRMVDKVIKGLTSNVYAYLDDFLVFSETFEDHQRHLAQLLDRFVEFGLFINNAKCKYGRRQVKFLGHELSANGIRPRSDKVAAIKNIATPTTVKELRRFLGIVGYYRPFLPQLAEIAAPLFDLTGGPKKKGKVSLAWNDTHQNAFNKVIETLSEKTTLSYEDPKLPLIISSDASLTHAGAVLEQWHKPEAELPHAPKQNDTPSATRPLSFYSKKFPRSVAVRSVFNRELSALFMAVKYYNFRLRGRSLIIRTDHYALIRAIENGTGDHSPNEERMLQYISEFFPVMIYLSGDANRAADLMSRPVPESEIPSLNLGEIPSASDEDDDPTDQTLNRPSRKRITKSVVLQSPEANTANKPPTAIINTVTTSVADVSPQIIAEQQLNEPELLAEVENSTKSIKSKLRFTKRPTPDNPNLILAGVTDTEGQFFRPIVPQNLRLMLFNILHNTLHQGQEKTAEVITAHYFWPSMTTDIKLWVKTCPQCQSCKISRHNRARLSNFPGINTRFHTIHADLVGPIDPVSNGFRYILTARDRATGFLVATPLLDKTTVSVITAFRGHFIGVLGIPSVIITDNGKEFTSNRFNGFCDQLGIKHKTTTAYHPQCNGKIERIHRTLKVALMALPPEDQCEWSSFLPFIILTINNLVVDNNYFTPFQKTFGQSGRLPGIFFFDDTTHNDPNVAETTIFLANMRLHIQKARALHNNKPFIEKDLFNCDKVWVKQPPSKAQLAPCYTGPYVVLHRENKFFIILTRSGQSKVSIDRLKTAYERTPEDTETPDNSTGNPQIPHINQPDVNVADDRSVVSDTEAESDEETSSNPRAEPLENVGFRHASDFEIDSDIDSDPADSIPLSDRFGLRRLAPPRGTWQPM